MPLWSLAGTSREQCEGLSIYLQTLPRKPIYSEFLEEEQSVLLSTFNNKTT